jgi:PIN domain nuclease of toxin-antitoxin system
VNQRVQSHRALVAVSILSAWRLTAVTDNHKLEPAVHIPSFCHKVGYCGWVHKQTDPIKIESDRELPRTSLGQQLVITLALSI